MLSCKKDYRLMSINFYSKKTLKLLSICFIISFSLFLLIRFISEFFNNIEVLNISSSLNVSREIFENDNLSIFKIFESIKLYA